jgi:hypothetical protein
LDITLLESTEREPNEVLTIQTCQNEEYLAVLTGKNLIMQEQKLNQIFVFKKRYNGEERDSFEPYTRIVIKDMPIFKQSSLQFHFMLKPGLNRDELVFARKDAMIAINFDTSATRVIY